MTSGRRVDSTCGPHEVDRPLAGGHVDARRAIRRPLAQPLTVAAHGHRLFEHELAARCVVGHGLRVVAVEAREAELVVRQVERREDAADRQVAERVGADEVADLGFGVGRGDELGLDGRVDAVEARVVDRRRADPDVDLGRARLAEQLDDPLGRRPAHDRIVDDDEALAVDDLAQRVELDRHAPVAQALRRLDEGPARVPVAVHPLAVRHARRLGEAGRGRSARYRGPA